jgi:hypothetical protein
MNTCKFSLILMATVAAAVLSPSAHSWGFSGARGSASGGWGSGSASDRAGGSASWSHGSGSVTAANGDSASWSHHGAAFAGADDYHPPGAGGAYGYHPYPTPAYGGGYHPPTAAYGYHPYPVPVYGGGYSSGQVAGAAVAGMAVGAMAGAAAASSQSAPPPSSPPTMQQESDPSQMPIGTRVSLLPDNCGNATVEGVEYYLCGPNWFKPYFGNSAVYYKVVAAPY